MVITIAVWEEVCTEAAAAVAAATPVSAVVIEGLVAGAVIASLVINYRIIQEVKIARPTNSLSLSRRRTLSKYKKNVICHRYGVKKNIYI